MRAGLHYADSWISRCVSVLQGLSKNIPGSPEGQPQIHEKKNPVYKGVQR